MIAVNMLEEFGDTLTTASKGKEAYSKLSGIIKDSEEAVHLCFDGVRLVSTSFADEAIGNLISDMGYGFFKNKVVIDIPDSINRMIINTVVAKRS